jgi:hypothetical protein
MIHAITEHPLATSKHLYTLDSEKSVLEGLNKIRRDRVSWDLMTNRFPEEV